MATPNQEIIDLDFEAYPPSDEDIPGIVMLLKQLFGGNEPLHLRQLAENLVAQNYVGCVLKQVESIDAGDGGDEAMDNEDEDTVYAFTTVLNLKSKKEVNCVSQLKTYLKGKAKGTPVESRFNDILDDSVPSNTGLIINERFVNLPSDVCVPMLESMLTDMDASTKKGMPYTFSHYIIVSKMYRLIDPPKTMHYVYPEDDLWANLQESDVYASFDYQMSTDMDTILVDGGNKTKPVTATLWRRVRVITSAGLLKLINIFKTNGK